MATKNPKPFVVFKNDRFQYVIHHYSREAAVRQVNDSEALVLGPVRKGSPLYQDIYRQD